MNSSVFLHRLKVFEMGLLDGKVALITGASRGIGKAIALKYAAEGADIAFTYVSANESIVEELVQEIAASGVRVRAYKANAADFALAQSLVEEIHKEFGHIDILVNNAGISDGMFPVDEVTDELWQKMKS